MSQTMRYEKIQSALDMAQKLALVAMPILMGVSGWTFTQLWNHEGRLTRIEARDDEFRGDLKEIKDITKQLLQYHMRESGR